MRKIISGYLQKETRKGTDNNQFKALIGVPIIKTLLNSASGDVFVPSPSKPDDSVVRTISSSIFLPPTSTNLAELNKIPVFLLAQKNQAKSLYDAMTTSGDISKLANETADLNFKIKGV